MPRKVKVNYHKRLTIKGAEIEEEGAVPRRCVFETSFERHHTNMEASTVRLIDFHS